MGSGGQKGQMHEIAETRAATRDAQFDAIVERITEAGGKIIEDQDFPLYLEIGGQDLEVGTERIVEFNLNKMDFKLSRKRETHAISGAGHQKHLEEMDAPRIDLSLKRKSETETEWQTVDMEDMF